MSLFVLIFLAIAFVAFILNYNLKKHRIKFNNKLSGDVAYSQNRFSSLTTHYAYCFILWNVIWLIIVIISSQNLVYQSCLIFAGMAINFVVIKWLFFKNFNAKKHFENFQTNMLSITTLVGILITLIVTFSILIETLRFFKLISPIEFFFGLNWNPQMAINSEQQVGASSFGMVPVFLGTLLITLVAMIVAVPIGIMSAIYLGMYAKSRTRDLLKPILEILAGVPTVVYGYFAVTTVAPFFKVFFEMMGLEISSESALSAGFVMGVMIIPFVLSLTDDAIASVPQALKDGALAIGSTKSEMIRKVVLVSAMPSIVGAIILAVSRAIGETMIVVMSAGLVAKLSFNPLDSVTTATAQIVTLLVGDQEFNSPKTLSAFALALTLFAFTFVLNIIALAVIKKYKR